MLRSYSVWVVGTEPYIEKLAGTVSGSFRGCSAFYTADDATAYRDIMHPKESIYKADLSIVADGEQSAADIINALIEQNQKLKKELLECGNGENLYYKKIYPLHINKIASLEKDLMDVTRYISTANDIREAKTFVFNQMMSGLLASKQQGELDNGIKVNDESASG